jgi:hypothetical protein
MSKIWTLFYSMKVELLFIILLGCMVGNRIILKIYIDYVVLNNVTCIYFFKKIDYIMETTQSIKLYIFSKKNWTLIVFLNFYEMCYF